MNTKRFVSILSQIGSLIFISTGICFIVREYLLEDGFSINNPIGYILILLGLIIIFLNIFYIKIKKLNNLKV